MYVLEMIVLRPGCNSLPWTVGASVQLVANVQVRESPSGAGTPSGSTNSGGRAVSLRNECLMDSEGQLAAIPHRLKSARYKRPRK